MDYYKILGVSEDASLEEIKAAHKKLYIAHHPNKHIHSENREYHENLAAEINAAYSILSDPKKRNEYDQKRYMDSHPQQKQNYYSTEFDMGDMGDFFKYSTGTQKTKEPLTSYDIKTTIIVTFEEIYNGEFKNIVYNRYITCQKCEGNTLIITKRWCRSCRGTGQKKIHQMFFMMGATMVTCSDCKGTGQEHVSCGCKSGIVNAQATYRLNLKNYSIPGKYNLEKLGHIFKSKRGNLEINIKISPDVGYSISEGYLVKTIDIDLKDILLRKPIAFNIFSETVKITIPSDFKSFTILNIPNKGFYNKDGKRSILKLKLIAIYPTLTEDCINF